MSATASCRVEVADEGEDRAARHEAGGLQGADVGGLDGGHVRAGRHLPGDGVVAEPLALQRLPRDRARLGPGDGDPLDQPLALAQHLGVRVLGVGEDVREHVEDRRQPGGEPGAADLQPLGIDADAQVRAHSGQLVVDPDAVPGRRAGEQRRGEQLGGGEVAGDRGVVGLGGVGPERDPQPQLGHRYPRVAGDEHPQAVGQRDVEDVRQRHLTCRPERGQGPRAGGGAADLLGGAVCRIGGHGDGHACSSVGWVPGSTMSTARPCPRSAAAASRTCSDVTAASRSGSSSASSARP